MASKDHSQSGKRDVPANSSATSSGSGGNYGKSGLKSTKMRGEEEMRGGQGGGVKGNPQRGGNRSGGQGNAAQQSDADRDGGASSRQTSSASEEKGQL